MSSNAIVVCQENQSFNVVTDKPQYKIKDV